MTFEPARPRYTLPFAGKDYELLGTFGMIEAVEYAMKDHVGRVAVKLVNGMTVTDLAKLISAILTSSGSEMSAQQAGDLLWDKVGITGNDCDILRIHIYSFLSICMAPPSQREKKAKEMGEKMGKLNGPVVSPGANTGESASAS